MWKISVFLYQGWWTSVLESRSSAEFCFNPNQTHLNKLIKAWRVTRKLQAGEFLLGLKLNSAGLRLSWTGVYRPWSIHIKCTLGTQFIDELMIWMRERCRAERLQSRGMQGTGLRIAALEKFICASIRIVRRQNRDSHVNICFRASLVLMEWQQVFLFSKAAHHGPPPLLHVSGGGVYQGLWCHKPGKKLVVVHTSRNCRH